MTSKKENLITLLHGSLEPLRSIPAYIDKESIYDECGIVDNDLLLSILAFLGDMSRITLDVEISLNKLLGIEAEMVKDVKKDDGAKWSAEKVLQNCKWDGERLTLPQIKLNKKSYGTVKSWIEEAGGKWNMKEQAFTFDFDADRVVEILMQGKRYNIKKEFQFFATPDVVADLVASKFSGIDANMKILEPSAGRGALVKAVLRSCPKAIIDCYELMPENRPFLEKIEGARIAGQDFLKECHTKYQRIIANPPFSNNQDIQHTYAMFDRLEYGGEMAVITSQHWKIATDSVCSDFRKWLDDKKASIEDIPEGAFKESGTQVKTTLIFIKKNRLYNDQLSLF